MKIKAKYLKELVGVLCCLTDEVKLRFEKNGLNIAVVDPGHIAMLNIHLSNDAFEDYTILNNDIGLDLNKFRNILTISKPDDRVKLSLDDNKFISNVGNITHEIGMVDPAGITDVNIPELDFKNKVVVITGGASGIGLATAMEFAEHGAKIALLDMNRQALESCKEQFTESGYDCMGLFCDVTDEESCQNAINRVLAAHGQIDILFNNAGITQRGLLESTKTEVFKKVMDVNFFGSLYCTKAALASLIKQKGQIIVNESVAGVAPLVGRTGYSASKHALHGLFTSLRCELRHKGVHVMIVCPGFIKTNLQQRALGSDGSIADHEQTRVGRQGTPKEAARQIVKHAARRKDMVVLTGIGKIGYLLSRITPRLYERVMTHRFRQELEQNN